MAFRGRAEFFGEFCRAIEKVIPPGKWRTIQLILDAGYADAYRLRHFQEIGHTFPTWDPHLRLDYVFVPAAFADRAITCDVVRHPDAASASDHFPVVADLLC